MIDVTALYNQTQNRAYIENGLGNDQWIQLCGHQKQNDADWTLYAYFIEQIYFETSFQSESWDLFSGDVRPSFEVNGEDVVYTKHDKDVHPIIHCRSFDGIFPDYIEISEEFRLLFNLAYDKNEDVYYSFDSSGTKELAIRIENDSVFILKKLIRRFIAAKRLVFVQCYDIAYYHAGTLHQYSLKELDENCSGPNYIYRIKGGNSRSFREEKIYSLLFGKKYLFPESIETCGIWPYDNQDLVYEDFIIGADENGDELYFTCDFDQLANYFGKNPEAPHYLTPVVFDKKVLTKYFNEPEKYAIKDGQLQCASLWSLGIDNHHENIVIVFLGDLGKYLPAKERQHWKQYNILSDAKLSTPIFERSMLGEWSEPIQADLVFRQAFDSFNNDWFKTINWHLFHALSPKDIHNLTGLHLPILNQQSEFDSFVLSLTKITIDSLNSSKIKSLLPKDKYSDLKGSINFLEAWLIEEDALDFSEHIQFLRNLQSLRSTGSGHRKGSAYDKAMQKFNMQNFNFYTVAKNILSSFVAFFSYMKTTFLN